MGRLYRSLFGMNACCDYCGLVYEREQGYFIGAIYINVIATESLLLGTLLIYGLITGTINQTILTVLIVLAIVMPLLFYHHSRSLWLCVDHILNPRTRRINQASPEGERTGTCSNPFQTDGRNRDRRDG